MGPPEIAGIELESVVWPQGQHSFAPRSLRWNSEHFRSVKGLLKAAPGKIPQEAELELVA
jgi:hypothetical protein